MTPFSILCPPGIPSISHLLRTALERKEKGTESPWCQDPCWEGEPWTFGAALLPGSGQRQLVVASPVGDQPHSHSGCPSVCFGWPGSHQLFSSLMPQPSSGPALWCLCPGLSADIIPPRAGTTPGCGQESLRPRISFTAHEEWD